MTTSTAPSPFFSFLGILGLLAAAMAVATTPYMGLATFAYCLMITGMFFRSRDRFLHRRLMFSAMGIDLSLVLLLEVQRDAIGTVTSLALGPFQMAHVAFSTMALLLYGPMIILGKKLWDVESPLLRYWHIRLGITAFLLRTLGFLLMFSLLWKAESP